MENLLKPFLNGLVENKENFTIYKETFGVGATRIMLYLAVRHAYAGRKVLLLINDDSSTSFVVKNLHNCINSMVGPDDEESQVDIKKKITLRRLSEDGMDTMTQRYTFNGVIEKADVIVSLHGHKFLGFAYNAQKTVLADGGVLPKGKTFAEFLDKREPDIESDDYSVEEADCGHKLCLSREGGNVLTITDGKTGETYTQRFDFDNLKFIEED